MRRRTAIVAIVLVVIAIVSGVFLCPFVLVPPLGNVRYDRYVENHLMEPVQVRMIGFQADIRPCSVRGDYDVPGVFGRTTYPVGVLDPNGSVLYEIQARLRKAGWQRSELWIRVPPNSETNCPAPVARTLVYRIENGTSSSLYVYLGESLLGHVAANSTATLGPMIGDWRHPAKLAFSATDSGTVPWVRDVAADFDLGDTPAIHYSLIDPGY